MATASASTWGYPEKGEHATGMLPFLFGLTTANLHRIINVDVRIGALKVCGFLVQITDFSG